jgi:hypothetical protein
MTGSHDPGDEETSVYVVSPLPGGPATGPPPPSPPPPSPPPTAPSPTPPVVGSVRPPLYAAKVRATYASSARAVGAGAVLVAYGLGALITGAVGAVAASALRRDFDQLRRDEGLRVQASALTGLLTALFILLLLLGALQLVAGGGTLAHRGWGRWLGVLLCLLGVAAAAALVYRLLQADATRLVALIALLAVLLPYLVALLGLLWPGDHFRRRGRAA